MTEKCLESIDKNTRHPFKLIIIADEPKEIDNEQDYDLYDYNYLLGWQEIMSIDIVIRKKREGVVSAYNLGMRMTKDDVLLTQNDVEFPELEEDCWLTRLVNKSKEENTGMVCCANSGNYNFVGGWCAYIPRKTINEIGYFDERFNPAMMDDVDYSKRVQLHGLRIVMESSFKVEHEGSATLKLMGRQTEEELKREKFRIYKEKWKDFFDGERELETLPIDKKTAKKYDYW